LKRDLGLVRELLIQIEEEYEGLAYEFEPKEGSEHNNDHVHYHLRLMIDAGLIIGKNTSTFDGSSTLIKGITWQGHDFLDASRNEKVWDDANKKAEENGSPLKSLPFEIAKELIFEASKRIFFGA
jgi:hypothetical protein